MTVFAFLWLVVKAVVVILAVIGAAALLLVWGTFQIERHDVGANPPRAR